MPYTQTKAGYDQQDKLNRIHNGKFKIKFILPFFVRVRSVSCNQNTVVILFGADLLQNNF
ncbi:hypothetical protein SOMG_04180 [Schizosaccharomyces osmophilus]|uniref:Uncharacterized protein n=1 Tax=Schizosaccharomyces osmophilus TaxID=2545709 RepID=A0AAE9WJI4_9SCHI|nr:uncharacterized protein SOMG_04180 [Schizosaccharomyces osmophilus]WBW75158.1 hypothetical protein SOMG_04180 [Schizosaccharomyces osmophilus]